MGLEARCAVRFQGKTSQGKALLESAALIFRGDAPAADTKKKFRLAIPFRDMKSVKAANGKLRVGFAEGAAVFDLGAKAEIWAHKILHPKSLLDKLGVKPGSVVSVLGVEDANFRRQLSEREAEISEGMPRKDSDILFFAAEQAADLERLRSVVPYLKKSGAIWVVYPKGQKRITQNDVMAASKKAGLVDVKVASFSATRTALKLVIPVARR